MKRKRKVIFSEYTGKEIIKAIEYNNYFLLKHLNLILEESKKEEIIKKEVNDEKAS